MKFLLIIPRTLSFVNLNMIPKGEIVECDVGELLCRFRSFIEFVGIMIYHCANISS